jgi:ribosomal protein S18 acetylase RimI-like enzyme
MTSSSPISYRVGTRADLALLAELGRDTFLETWSHLYCDEDLQDFLSKVHTVESVAYDFDHGRHFWIAEQGDHAVGYCKAGPVGVPVDVGARRSAELKQLYVRRSHHGCGVGDRLMQFFLEWVAANQIQDAYISCWSENYRALRFYRRHGFEECGKYLYQVGKQFDDERILKRSFDGK